MKSYDLIIVGGGPAGLTAALYALRAGKTVLVIEKETFGGQITYSPKVENYPGYAVMSGNEFAEKLVDQVLGQGAEVEMAAVTAIRDGGKTKTVVTDGESFEAKAVVVATGARHRMLGLPNEEKLVGEGISFCAVCDGAFYQGKQIGVVGGGNSAMQEALLLSETAGKVTMIQNLETLTGEKRLAAEIEKRDNIEVIVSTVVKAVEGDETLSGVVLKNTQTGAETKLTLDGLFIAIGLIPQNEKFKNLFALDDYGYANSGEDCMTKTRGVFVAGDCRRKKVRQVTTAVSDGAIAALAACEYIDRMG